MFKSLERASTSFHQPNKMSHPLPVESVEGNFLSAGPLKREDVHLGRPDQRQQQDLLFQDVQALVTLTGGQNSGYSSSPPEKWLIERAQNMG